MNNYLDLLKIIRSIINNSEYDKKGIDYNALFDLSENLNVTAYIFNKLDKNYIDDITYSKFLNHYNNAIKRRILFNNEKRIIINELEKKGIRYLPFKGDDLNKLYPKLYIREFADVDILVDDELRTKDIMLNRGYSLHEEKVENVYSKDIYTIEMHKVIFDQLYDYGKYFSDAFNIAIKDKDNKYGYHFDDETLYCYLIGHLYKHNNLYGIGIRNYIDLYYYRLNKKLDNDRLNDLLIKLGLKEYNDETIKLINDLFINDINNIDEEKLKLIFGSGAFGLVNNRVNREIDSRGKIGYIIYRLFPPFRYMLAAYPILKKLPILYPIMLIIRFFEIIFNKNRRDILSKEKNAYLKK